MRQFDVFANPSPKSRAAVPLLIALQHDRASETASVMVAGLVPIAKARAIAKSRLYPIVAVNGNDYVLLTPNMAALPRKLALKPVANVGGDQRKIIEAIDMLFTGF